MDENALRAAGIDYDAALARFMGKQAIYEKYLRKLPEDAHMDAAWTAFEQQDDAELLEHGDCCALTCRNARRTAGENDVIKTGVGPRL